MHNLENEETYKDKPWVHVSGYVDRLAKYGVLKNSTYSAHSHDTVRSWRLKSVCNLSPYLH